MTLTSSLYSLCFFVSFFFFHNFISFSEKPYQKVGLLNAMTCLVGSAFASFLLCFYFSQGSTCGPPTPPYGSVIIHPSVQGQYKNGSLVLFGCKQGFYLVGPPLIKCTGNTWTKIKFRCIGMKLVTFNPTSFEHCPTLHRYLFSIRYNLSSI